MLSLHFNEVSYHFDHEVFGVEVLYIDLNCKTTVITVHLPTKK